MRARSGEGVSRLRTTAAHEACARFEMMREVEALKARVTDAARAHAPADASRQSRTSMMGRAEITRTLLNTAPGGDHLACGGAARPVRPGSSAGVRYSRADPPPGPDVAEQLLAAGGQASVLRPGTANSALRRALPPGGLGWLGSQ